MILSCMYVFVLSFTIRFHMLCPYFIVPCVPPFPYRYGSSSGRLTLQDGVQEVMFGADLKPIVSSFQMTKTVKKMSKNVEKPDQIRTEFVHMLVFLETRCAERWWLHFLQFFHLNFQLDSLIFFDQ